MGAKNLKAVVARDPPPEIPPALRELRERADEAFADSDAGRWLAAGDTLETVAFGDETGVLPTRGWQARRFDGAEGLGVERVDERATGRERPDDPFRAGSECRRVKSVRTTPPRRPRHPDQTVPRGGTPIALGAGLRNRRLRRGRYPRRRLRPTGDRRDLRRQRGRVGGPCERRTGLIDPADHGVDRGSRSATRRLRKR